MVFLIYPFPDMDVRTVYLRFFCCPAIDGISYIVFLLWYFLPVIPAMVFSTLYFLCYSGYGTPAIVFIFYFPYIVLEYSYYGISLMVFMICFGMHH